MDGKRGRRFLNTARPCATDAHARPALRAFTLLELLATMAMAMLLLGALYHALFQTIFATAEGDKVVAQAQLTRAVMNLMAGDLRSALSGEGLEGSHFSGSSDQVSVCCARVRRDVAVASEATAGTGDVVKVTYSMRGGAAQAGGASLVRQEQPGVAISEGSRLSAELDVDLGSGLDSGPRLQSSSCVLAKGLAALKLRYAGDQGWQDSWDSKNDGGPPKAVEITLTFMDALQDADEEPAPESVFGTEEAARVYRLVVFVPTGGKPEEVASMLGGRRRSETERKIRGAFGDHFREMTRGMDERLKRSRLGSMRSTGMSRVVTGGGASTGGGGDAGGGTASGGTKTTQRKTRPGAWGLRPMD